MVPRIFLDVVFIDSWCYFILVFLFEPRSRWILRKPEYDTTMLRLPRIALGIIRVLIGSIRLLVLLEEYCVIVIEIVVVLGR